MLGRAAARSPTGSISPSKRPRLFHGSGSGPASAVLSEDASVLDVVASDIRVVSDCSSAFPGAVLVLQLLAWSARASPAHISNASAATSSRAHAATTASQASLLAQNARQFRAAFRAFLFRNDHHSQHHPSEAEPAGESIAGEHVIPGISRHGLFATSADEATNPAAEAPKFRMTSSASHELELTDPADASVTCSLLDARTVADTYSGMMVTHALFQLCNELLVMTIEQQGSFSPSCGGGLRITPLATLSRFELELWPDASGVAPLGGHFMLLDGPHFLWATKSDLVLFSSPSAQQAIREDLAGDSDAMEAPIHVLPLELSEEESQWSASVHPLEPESVSVWIGSVTPGLFMRDSVTLSSPCSLPVALVASKSPNDPTQWIVRLQYLVSTPFGLDETWLSQCTLLYESFLPPQYASIVSCCFIAPPRIDSHGRLSLVGLVGTIAEQVILVCDGVPVCAVGVSGIPSSICPVQLPTVSLGNGGCVRPCTTGSAHSLEICAGVVLSNEAGSAVSAISLSRDGRLQSTQLNSSLMHGAVTLPAVCHCDEARSSDAGMLVLVEFPQLPTHVADVSSGGETTPTVPRVAISPVPRALLPRLRAGGGADNFNDEENLFAIADPGAHDFGAAKDRTCQGDRALSETFSSEDQQRALDRVLRILRSRISCGWEQIRSLDVMDAFKAERERQALASLAALSVAHERELRFRVGLLADSASLSVCLPSPAVQNNHRPSMTSGLSTIVGKPAAAESQAQAASEIAVTQVALDQLDYCVLGGRLIVVRCILENSGLYPLFDLRLVLQAANPNQLDASPSWSATHSRLEPGARACIIAAYYLDAPPCATTLAQPVLAAWRFAPIDERMDGASFSEQLTQFSDRFQALGEHTLHIRARTSANPLQSTHSELPAWSEWPNICTSVTAVELRTKPEWSQPLERIVTRILASLGLVPMHSSASSSSLDTLPSTQPASLLFTSIRQLDSDVSRFAFVTMRASSTPGVSCRLEIAAHQPAYGRQLVAALSSACPSGMSCKPCSATNPAASDQLAQALHARLLAELSDAGDPKGHRVGLDANGTSAAWTECLLAQLATDQLASSLFDELQS
ncbi:hypothetical protein CAOG_00682 [Capsaspora owczarzaki ATCC 30864]|uniref:Uncharacterized protein n=1 Tax=Capsaspora owczarzaki (strain ATCC 30864) TaxID=595528 RepID=A0A0D2WJ04_CAPO3|nr:hypothetical protein CAOG_00682 [Capsaspora owczarzaki ATCC 30864]KJE89153.1 hypothetical protein CAOG_000682 [Capsaspora owczarzaki ATCC 30864]|eukprot:XP_004365553.1 hypothetical protein CAOG_00682 [Capsaspora owczarzaki ATCC 30864]